MANRPALAETGDKLNLTSGSPRHGSEEQHVQQRRPQDAAYANLSAFLKDRSQPSRYGRGVRARAYGHCRQGIRAGG